MANQINGFPPSWLQGTTGQSSVQADAPEERGVPPKDRGPAPEADVVSLTDTPKRLQRLAQALSALPVVESERVQALAKAINDGTYQLNTGRVAEKLIALEQALGVRRG